MRFLLPLALVLVACGSGGSDDTGGAPALATSQAIANLSGSCAIGPMFKVGQFSNASPEVARAVKNGETEEGQAVSVSCRVAPSGSDFAVEVAITVGSSSLAIEDGVDSKGQSLTAKVDMTSGGKTWSSASCKLEASGTFHGIAAGRYWAIVTCTDATSHSGDTCTFGGELRVENCTQN
jgi:hypothetical protein